ncbi:MAG: hypothetical protein IJX75_04795 [Clostridia bacterium]|nr:hypothetical protein [Clostridia bacterium]
MSRERVLPRQIELMDFSDKQAITNEGVKIKQDQIRLLKKICVDLEITHMRLIFAVDGVKELQDRGEVSRETEMLNNVIQACGYTANALQYARAALPKEERKS